MGAISKRLRIKGIVIVAISITIPIKTAMFSFLFENGLYEKIGLYKLLKEKEITKIYVEKQTKKTERATSMFTLK